MFSEKLGDVEKFADRIDAEHTDAPKGRIETASLPVSAPVCDAAAFAAAAVRPTLITIIGFVRATSRAAERNERASPTDSM